MHRHGVPRSPFRRAGSTQAGRQTASQLPVSGLTQYYNLACKLLKPIGYAARGGVRGLGVAIQPADVMPIQHNVMRTRHWICCTAFAYDRVQPAAFNRAKRRADPVVSPTYLLGVSEWSAFARHSLFKVEVSILRDRIRAPTAALADVVASCPSPIRIRLCFLQDRFIYDYR